MAHEFGLDDKNIIEKCREYGFCCTYDPEGKFDDKNVTDAIEGVLAARAEQSKKLTEMIAKTEPLTDPLQELIESAGALMQASKGDNGPGSGSMEGVAAYQGRLVEEKARLTENLGRLKAVRNVMDRKYIRVPVVGVINSGKSTFLHSALGGGVNDTMKENLFPSAGAHKSCTGTRTVLIYDHALEGVKVIARFKGRRAFFNDCLQSVGRMVRVLGALGILGQFKEIQSLEKNLKDQADQADKANQPDRVDSISPLSSYYQSGEFQKLCEVAYQNARYAESVHNFCSFVYFIMNQDYSEDRMYEGIQKDYFQINELVKRWDENTSYSMEISSDHDFKQVRNFVCKYDPNPEHSANRYTTYCGIEVVEIRGKLCEEIAGLELIDSVGADDDAISTAEQMEQLVNHSDAMILLERPQALKHGGWQTVDYVDFLEEQKKVSGQFLYLVYNSYQNNTTVPSDLYLSVVDANKYRYRNFFGMVYVSDVGEWEEVQSKMLVDLLVHVSDSVETTHREALATARKANAEIAESVMVIRQTAESLGRICSAKEEDASEKKRVIDEILKELFGKVETLIFEIRDEKNTELRVCAENITDRLVEKIQENFESVTFKTAYEYVSPTGPEYLYNRYVAFLCMYSHMLEDAGRQYDALEDKINVYVEDIRKKLLGILWEEGRFGRILSAEGSENISDYPKADKICAWLRQDKRELLAGVLEELLLKDVGAEGLIDGSIGKIIEQFDPKNLTAEQLFGLQMTDPELEKNEDRKAGAIKSQLLAKAEELRAALSENVSDASSGKASGDAMNRSDTEKAGNQDTKKNFDDLLWKKEPSPSEPSEQKAADTAEAPGKERDNLFDLDQMVRRDVVCDGILKKFREKLRGDGSAQNAEQQLYNLYDGHYNRLLSPEEVEKKESLERLRQKADKYSGQLSTFCQEWQQG